MNVVVGTVDPEHTTKSVGSTTLGTGLTVTFTWSVAVHPFDAVAVKV